MLCTLLRLNVMIYYIVVNYFRSINEIQKYRH